MHGEGAKVEYLRADEGVWVRRVDEWLSVFRRCRED